MSQSLTRRAGGTTRRQTAALKQELRKAIVGQDAVIDDVILALFGGEHALLTGVPGLAKTLLIRSLAEALDLSFKRIQFTPDPMPSDITGTEIVQEDPESGRRQLEFLQGPVFANLLLADEINRTPPKTQAAMLQTCRSARSVSAGRPTRCRARFLFSPRATRSSRSTYQLPEAATDRFMLSIQVNYPTVDEEIGVVSETTGVDSPELSPVLSGAEVLQFQRPSGRCRYTGRHPLRRAAGQRQPTGERAGDHTIRESSGSVPGLVAIPHSRGHGPAAIAGDPA